MHSADRVKYRVENQVAYLTISNAACANTLDEAIQVDMLDYLQAARFDGGVRVIVIEAEGRIFSGGGPLDQLRELTDHPEEQGALMDECLTFPGAVTSAIRRVEKPVIGALQGAVAGAAANIMLGCDFRIVTEDMFLLEAFVKVGLCTDGGGAYILSRLIGAAKATELVMLAQPLPAEDALRLGLVNKIVPRDALREETQKFALQLAQGPAKSYHYLKQLINQAAFYDIETAFATEVEYQRICLRSQDAKEGISAFLDKRKPVFQGK